MHEEIATVGLDLAKSVFQVHAIGADGKVIIRRQLRRAEMLKFLASLSPCLVGMEACASAHHWGRELRARPRCTADASSLCEAICETGEDVGADAKLTRAPTEI